MTVSVLSIPVIIIVTVCDYRFAFVEFSDVTAVDAALKQELEMDGRQLYLSRAGDGGGGRPKFQRTYHHHISNALHFFFVLL